MPITAQAIKKLRHDRKRSKQNARVRKTLGELVKAARTNPSKKSLSLAFQIVDKAVKARIIHANKAARLKSRLAKRSVKK